MNAIISKLMAKVSNLDDWTQAAVYGSWNFLVSAACINQAGRYVPGPLEVNTDGKIDNGIDVLTPYDEARRRLIKDAENSTLPGLLTLRSRIVQEADTVSTQVRDLEDTLKFMRGNMPKKETFEADYRQRIAMGMKPGMSMKQFVDHEMEQAAKQHNHLVAVGEDAVRLCETMTISTHSDELPDWVAESMERKLIDKLHDRWEKLEFIRTDLRKRKSIRDSADASQRLIKAVLAEFGETPGFTAEPDPSEAEKAADVTKVTTETEAPVAPTGELATDALEAEVKKEAEKPKRTRVKAEDLAGQA